MTMVINDEDWDDAGQTRPSHHNKVMNKQTISAEDFSENSPIFIRRNSTIIFKLFYFDFPFQTCVVAKLDLVQLLFLIISRYSFKNIYFIIDSRLEDGQIGVNITGGPLQYQYQAEQLFVHWGRNGLTGSEHSVNHQSWPAEIQLYGYNSQLYNNLTEAQEMPGGVVGVAIMVQVIKQSCLSLANVLIYPGKYDNH